MPTATWGGRRAGAGRPPTGKRRGGPHRTRPRVSYQHPLHVTLRVHPHVWSLRSRRSFRRLRAAFAGGSNRFGFRLVHYSVQGNHLHLVVEARSRGALSRGMQGLAVRIARRLNRMMGVRGPVFDGRFFARVLGTTRQVRNALSYVLCNARRHAAQHGRTFPRGWLDPYSSAARFDGWKRSTAAGARAVPDEPDTVPARSGILRWYWREHGLLDPSAVPGRARTAPS